MTVVGSTPFDWSQVDLSRHDRLFEHAQLVVEMVKTHVVDLDAILREFRAVANDKGLDLRYEREPDTLHWTLTLTGKGFRVRGTVEIALESASCVAITARPDDEQAVRYELELERLEEFPARLSAEFRTAAVSSVLGAARVISL